MDNLTVGVLKYCIFVAEILDFCDFISPSTEEQSSRTAAVQDVSDVVKHIWPQCKASHPLSPCSLCQIAVNHFGDSHSCMAGGSFWIFQDRSLSTNK